MNGLFYLRGLHVALGKKRILNDIRLSIPEGGFISIVGRNGSGKTTLIKTLASIIHPESGQIHYKGKPLASYSPRSYSREVSYVPQFLQIEFDYTVMEFVLLGRLPHTKILGTSSSHHDREIAGSALKRVGCDDLSDRSIRTLSGGERQKVMIAQSIVQESSTILLDEPTSHLDLANQMEILDILKNLSQNGKTVISILHDLNHIRCYSDRVIMLKKGELMAEGLTVDVITEESVFQCLDVRLKF